MRYLFIAVSFLLFNNLNGQTGLRKVYFEFAWTKDGRTVYFTEGLFPVSEPGKPPSVPPVFTIFKMNLDGSGKTLVKDSATSPAISPDACLIYY